MPLTASALRAASTERDRRRRDDPRDRTARKLYDREGLYAHVRPSGIFWRFRYQHQGRRRDMALGRYPDISLADARRLHAVEHATLKGGRDPIDAREEDARTRRLAQAHRFEDVAREWMERQDWSDGHRRTVELRLANDVFEPRGILGDRPVGELTAPEVLECLRRIEARGAHETAKRVRQIVGQICRYAVGTGRALHDPTSALPRDAIRRVQPIRMAHTTDPARLGEILRAIDGYTGSFPVRCALQLQPLLAVRPGELRGAEWREFDLDAKLWRIPAVRMKRSSNGDQVVPLVQAAIDILTDLEPLTGRGRLLFPGQRSVERPISDVTLNAALRRLDISADELVGHGWRHIFSTLANESGEFDPDVIEDALHHVDGSVRGRYNSAKRLEERRRLMEWWAARLARFRTGAEIVELVSHAS